MESDFNSSNWIQYISQAAFSVRDSRVENVNSAAAGRMIEPGTEIETLIVTGQEAFAGLKNGCLYLTLCIHSRNVGAEVMKAGDGSFLFLLDSGPEEEALQALALAARELRGPLGSLLLCADLLKPDASLPAAREADSQMRRSISQLIRLVGNMSDAGGCSQLPKMQNCCLTAVLDEIFERARTLAQEAGRCLEYKGLSEDVFGAADRDMIERAIYNLISNAIKFSPEGSTIACRVVKKGRLLLVQIRDSGCGIADSRRSSLFTRYRREPSIEDRLQGIGLGMVTVRSTAMAHGGSVLVESAPGSGTRVTLTLAVQKGGDRLHSPVLRVDYAGEQDHGSIELSDVLPASHYQR